MTAETETLVERDETPDILEVMAENEDACGRHIMADRLRNAAARIRELEAQLAEAREAADRLRVHHNGRYLRDNDASREAISDLITALPPHPPHTQPEGQA